jgi:hypothetical protein
MLGGRSLLALLGAYKQVCETDVVSRNESCIEIKLSPLNQQKNQKQFQETQ